MSDGLYDVCWDFKAGEDLDQIYKYLLENASENVAKKVKKEIVSAVSRLRHYPESYPLDPHYCVPGLKNFITSGFGNIKSSMNSLAKSALSPGYFILVRI